MLKELILEGQNRYFDSEICQNMPVSDSEIEELCKSMKETALKNTWQDSEKAKIKDVTKNTLISWGVLKDAEGKGISDKCLCTFNRQNAANAGNSMWCV